MIPFGSGKGFRSAPLSHSPKGIIALRMIPFGNLHFLSHKSHNRQFVCTPL